MALEERAMNNFIVSDWFAKRADLNIQTFVVEGVVFELMALTESLSEDIEGCESHEEMLSMAADMGISYNRSRVFDDAELAKDIDKLWSLADLDVECDPSIKAQVGKKVCEISGLTSMLEDMIEAEKEAAEALNNIDGDNLPDEDVTLGQLHDDANAVMSHS